jgi:hypothetical protein
MPHDPFNPSRVKVRFDHFAGVRICVDHTAIGDHGHVLGLTAHAKEQNVAGQPGGIDQRFAESIFNRLAQAILPRFAAIPRDITHLHATQRIGRQDKPGAVDAVMIPALMAEGYA